MDVLKDVLDFGSTEPKKKIGQILFSIDTKLNLCKLEIWLFRIEWKSERERDRKSIEWTNENFINTLTECIVMIFCLFAGYDNDDDSDGGGNRLSIEMFSRRISEFFFVPVVEW